MQRNLALKIRYGLLLVSLLFCLGETSSPLKAANAAGTPSVVIEKRRVVIVRKGQFVRDFPDRRRATILYPVVRGPQSSDVLQKVRAILNLKNVFDSSIEEYRQDTWLSELDYKINYNQNYILDITFTESGVGAYPDTHTKHFAINLRNGELIKASDAFKSPSLDSLTSLLDAKLQAEIKQIIKDNPAAKEDSASLFGDLKYKGTDLDNFSISSRGITFLYDAGFPHVNQALAPNGQYFFTYSKLKEFINPDGPLGVFVR
ncbi:MAG: hypothetical protein QOJ64_1785 [Acidobacteriota bacterium]|jgi:hypothetical protein|nr:hypothetical protein [Acidobacteriota bacterium]